VVQDGLSRGLGYRIIFKSVQRSIGQYTDGFSGMNLAVITFLYNSFILFDLNGGLFAIIS
jgi:hypothetical protein